MKLMNKKGQGVFDAFGALGVGIAGLAITLVVAFLIISQGRSQVESQESLNGSVLAGETSVAWNATRTLGQAVDTIPDWIPLVVIATIGVILLVLIQSFRG